MNYFKYYTPKGYKQTNDKELAENMAKEHNAAYIEGFLGRCGGIGVWSWLKRTDYPLLIFPKMQRDWHGKLGWNSFDTL